MTVLEWSCDTNYSVNIIGETSELLRLCPIKLLYAVVPVLVMVLTIAGNIFVIVAVLTNARNRRKRTSILICNLALADLVVGSVIMPLAISNIITDSLWLYGRHVCRGWISLDIVCCTASIVTLCLISIDRFIGVTKPLQYTRLVTRRRLLFGVVCVWLFSVVTLVTTINWSPDAQLLLYQYYPCSIINEHKHILYAVFLSFCVPLAVILSVYYKIYQVTSRREKSLLQNLHKVIGRPPGAPEPDNDSIDSETHSEQESEAEKECPLPPREDDEDDNNEAAKEELKNKRSSFMLIPLRIHYGGGSMEKQRKFYNKHKKTAKTLSIIVGAFLICWMPFFILYMYNYFRSVPDIVMDLFTWLGYTNSMVNPIIYGLSMRDFKDTLRVAYARLFGGVVRRCCCACCPALALATTQSAVKQDMNSKKTPSLPLETNQICQPRDETTTANDIAISFRRPPVPPSLAEQRRYTRRLLNASNNAINQKTATPPGGDSFTKTQTMTRTTSEPSQVEIDSGSVLSGGGGVKRVRIAEERNRCVAYGSTIELSANAVVDEPEGLGLKEFASGAPGEENSALLGPAIVRVENVDNDHLKPVAAGSTVVRNSNSWMNLKLYTWLVSAKATQV